MKNILSYLSHIPKAYAIFALIAVVIVVPVVARATEGDTPVFNSFETTPYSGDERDFLRVGTGGSNSYADSVEACTGEVDLWVYIHNDQESEENGENFDGPAVAHDVRLAVNIPGEAGNVITPDARITASNASTVTDTATITCGGHEVEVDYIPGSAQIYTADRGYQPLSDEVVTNPNGTLVGSLDDDGEVPACWEFRNWVTLTVKVKEVEKPTPVYECTALNPLFIDRNTRKLAAESHVANGAKVVSYDFAYGDGATETVKTSNLAATTNEHSYAAGSYMATVDVNFDIDGDGKADTSDRCKAPIEINEEPVYKCVALTPSQDPNNRLSWTFSTKVSHSKDVTVNKYIYNFGDGSDKFSTDQNKVTKVYKDYGKYIVGVEVVFNVGDGQKSDSCSTSVEMLKTPPVTPPVTPPTTPPAAELPNTGPASIIAGIFGTGALSYGAVSLRASRNGLRNKILGREED